MLTLGNEEENEQEKNDDDFGVKHTRMTVVKSEEELKEFVDSLTPKWDKNLPEDEDTVYGVKVGNTCPICRKGTVEEIGGCNTCTLCQAQLTCGL